jgi:probable HAF family extracellular repeat protein
LGVLGSGTVSHANDINDSGQVAGDSNLNGATHAFRSSPNGQPVTLTDLGTLGGSTSSAIGINALGVLVGDSSVTNSGFPHAFVYDTQMRDLNSLLVDGSGWVLIVAEGVNDVGQIVGFGMFDGQTHGFRLTPVPEPSALTLLGAAAIAGFAARKRKPAHLASAPHIRNSHAQGAHR